MSDLIKHKDFRTTVGTNYWDPLSNKISLSWKLGINIPIYHISDKKKANKFMYTPSSNSSNLIGIIFRAETE